MRSTCLAIVLIVSGAQCIKVVVCACLAIV